MPLLPTRLELRIAARYLRSRRATRGLSLNALIATGGVAVGVMALIVVLGIMNGLRNDLRDRILVGSPHLRVLTYGAGLRMDDWRQALGIVRRLPGVVAAAPEVISQAGITAGADYGEGVNVVGFDPDTGKMSVTSLPRSIRCSRRSAGPSSSHTPPTSSAQERIGALPPRHPRGRSATSASLPASRGPIAPDDDPVVQREPDRARNPARLTRIVSEASVPVEAGDPRLHCD